MNGLTMRSRDNQKETNESKNTMTPWNRAKAILRQKFTTMQAYLKEQEKSQINNLTPKDQKKNKAQNEHKEGNNKKQSENIQSRV